jgi:hypothetical protein
MSETYALKDAFDAVMGDLAITPAFIGKIYTYQIRYLNKNEEHLTFFASNLIGVHVVRFGDLEILKFFREVLDIDYQETEREIRKVTTIDHDYKVGGDIFNLTMMYVIHRILTSSKLSETQKKRGAYDMALVFFYRCLAIRQSEYFPFPADPKIAQAAYARLSNRFMVKKLGSWQKVMDHHAKHLIEKEPKGLHLKNLIRFVDDTSIVYSVTNSEGGIRDMYKNYTAVFHQTREEGERFGSSASTQIDLEGVEKVKEKIKSVEMYTNYLRSIVVDKESFVRRDLISVVLEINGNASQRIVTHTLGWISDNYNHAKHHSLIDEWMTLVIVHSFHLLKETSADSIKDYAGMLLTLKNLYLSTRSTDKDLMRIRDVGEKIVKEANGKINSSLSMATRTSVILYLTLRAVSGKTSS